MPFLKTFRGRLVCVFLALNISLLTVSLIYGTITEDALSSGREAVECYLKHNYYIYCLGCGGSRSLVALLNFDLISSFLYFPALPISALLIADVDVRCIIAFIKNSDKPLLSFKSKSLIIIPTVILFTFFMRNLLLFGFGIDTLGDVTNLIAK